MMSDKFAVIDIETTGSRRFGQKIIEIAIICLDGDEIVSEWSTLINPEKDIPYTITQLTGIDEGMVLGAPRFYEVAKKIVELTEDRIFIAHNVYFDYKFIQSEFSDLGFSYRREVLCTVKLARRAFPDLSSYSLSSLSKHFSFPREAEHRALDDAAATVKLFLKIKQELKGDLLPEKFQLPPHVEEKNFQSLPELPGTYSFYTSSGHLLYVGKAKNIYARVKSHFSTLGKNKRDTELRQHVAKIYYRLWGSEELASLMELHEIKTLFPSLNRASRKRRYRYSLSLSLNSLPGDEVRIVSSPKSEEGLFGSRQVASSVRKRAYREAFGIEPDSHYFLQEMKKWRTILGDEVVLEKLKNYLKLTPDILPDGIFAFSVSEPLQQAQLIIEGGELKELRLLKKHEEEIYPLSSFPDMKRLVSRFLRDKVLKKVTA